MKAKKPAGWKKLFDSEEFGSRYEYEGTDLGVTLHDADTVFKVWAPTAEEVLLNLYESGTEGTDDRISSLPMKRGAKGVWSANIDENLKNRYYTYTVTADGQTNETQDVYTRACGVNGRRSMIVDLRETDPAGWEEDSFCYDAGRLPVIYELHVKDFSFAESSGIPAEYRGKYKAFTVTDSVLCGAGGTLEKTEDGKWKFVIQEDGLLKDRTTVEGRAKHLEEIAETQGGFYANPENRKIVQEKLKKYKEKQFKTI